jgi:hypothetical protein
MGIDLKVLASHFREHHGEFLATAALRFDRDARFFAQFAPDAEPCVVQPLPPGLKVGHHEDEGLRWDEADCNGAPLTFTTPGDHALTPMLHGTRHGPLKALPQGTP